MTLQFLRGQPGFMRSVGIETHAISAPGPELDSFASTEGITPHSVPMRRTISPFRDLVALWRLYRLFRALKPDIVHAHTPKGGLLGMLAAFLARVRTRIYHVHGLPMLTSKGLRRAILRATETTSCALATQVLCVSRSVRTVFVEEGLCRADKIHVLLAGSINGVDADGDFAPQQARKWRDETRRRVGIPMDAQVVLFVGRLVRDKGIVELADAWSELRSLHPAAHLLVVGPFEPHDPLPQETRSALREDPRAHLVGLDWNVAPYYAASDVVAFPTYREGFPVVPLEAAALELPVVATTVTGCIDAVENGRTGTLIAPGDARALREALHAYLENPELARRHGTAARARVLRDFRPEDMWRAVLQFYRAATATAHDQLS